MSKWSGGTYGMVREVIGAADLSRFDEAALVGAFARRFLEDNPRFDVARFYEECGVDAMDVAVALG
jgi:hypothetical protein